MYHRGNGRRRKHPGDILETVGPCSYGDSRSLKKANAFRCAISEQRPCVRRTGFPKAGCRGRSVHVGSGGSVRLQCYGNGASCCTSGSGSFLSPSKNLISLLQSAYRLEAFRIGETDLHSCNAFKLVSCTSFAQLGHHAITISCRIGEIGSIQAASAANRLKIL